MRELPKSDKVHAKKPRASIIVTRGMFESDSLETGNKIMTWLLSLLCSIVLEVLPCAGSFWEVGLPGYFQVTLLNDGLRKLALPLRQVQVLGLLVVGGVTWLAVAHELWIQVHQNYCSLRCGSSDLQSAGYSISLAPRVGSLEKSPKLLHRVCSMNED